MKWTPIYAILSITVLVAIAILKGVDGYLISVALTIIAALGGYSIGKKKSP